MKTKTFNLSDGTLLTVTTVNNLPTKEGKSAFEICLAFETEDVEASVKLGYSSAEVRDKDFLSIDINKAESFYKKVSPSLK